LSLRDVKVLHFFKSSAIVANCSNAASRSSMISRAMTSGAGRFAEFPPRRPQTTLYPATPPRPPMLLEDRKNMLEKIELLIARARPKIVSIDDQRFLRCLTRLVVAVASSFDKTDWPWAS
jgi:hypothetical protein